MALSKEDTTLLRSLLPSVISRASEKCAVTHRRWIIVGFLWHLLTWIIVGRTSVVVSKICAIFYARNSSRFVFSSKYRTRMGIHLVTRLNRILVVTGLPIFDGTCLCKELLSR